MKKLWAPWRSRYVRIKEVKGCIFCEKPKGQQNYLIKRNKTCFAMLNIFPYNNGHLMVAPFRHVKDIERLNDAEIMDLWRLVAQMVKILKRTIRPQGFNIGINIGREAGAGYEGHLHIHIVPRWGGDTNFMPVLANTKILPQSLEELYKRLKKCKI